MKTEIANFPRLAQITDGKCVVGAKMPGTNSTVLASAAVGAVVAAVVGELYRRYFGRTDAQLRAIVAEMLREDSRRLMRQGSAGGRRSAEASRAAAGLGD